MVLPSQLVIKNLGSLTINTFGLFLIFALILVFFVVWSEGKKDGFDTDRLFDLFLISLFFAILISRVVFGLNHALSAKEFFSHLYKVQIPGYNLLGGVLGFLSFIFILSKVWNWSFYRLLDIFSLGASLGLSVIMLGYIGLQGKFEYLFAFSTWVFLYALLSKFRNTKIRSGYIFCLFMPATGILKMIFFKSGGDLRFTLVLVTLSIVVFIFRWRLSDYDGKIIKRFIRITKEKIRRKKERFSKRKKATK